MPFSFPCQPYTHPTQCHPGKKVIYDLGVRKDVSTGSKKWQDMLASGAKLDCGPDVAETLVQHGIDLESITAVIWGYVTVSSRLPLRGRP